jgi:hypothetical protein
MKSLRIGDRLNLKVLPDLGVSEMKEWGLLSNAEKGAPTKTPES